MSRVHFMLDIETLGQTPTAPVVSFAAVAFTPGVRQDDYAAYKAVVSPKDQPGRPMEFDTVRWWMTQPREASAHWTDPAQPEYLEVALHGLYEFKRKNKGDENLWWAYSPQFDMIIMEGLYRENNLAYQTPWTYRDLRDVRTIRPYLNDQSGAARGTAHDPLHDCISQIEYVHRFYEQMRLV